LNLRVVVQISYVTYRAMKSFDRNQILFILRWIETFRILDKSYRHSYDVGIVRANLKYFGGCSEEEWHSMRIHIRAGCTIYSSTRLFVFGKSLGSFRIVPTCSRSRSHGWLNVHSAWLNDSSHFAARSVASACTAREMLVNLFFLSESIAWLCGKWCMHVELRIPAPSVDSDRPIDSLDKLGTALFRMTVSCRP